MHVKSTLRSALLTMVVISGLTISCHGDIWMSAPQICGGRTWSPTARSAGWHADLKERVCRATPKDGPMVANVTPLENGNFILLLALRMGDGATSRLTMDEMLFELSNDGQHISFNGDPKKRTHKTNRKKDNPWSFLRIDRRDGMLLVTLNETKIVELKDNHRSFKRISLESTNGTIKVNHFRLVGKLVKQKPIKKDDVQANHRASTVAFLRTSPGFNVAYQGPIESLLITGYHLPEYPPKPHYDHRSG